MASKDPNTPSRPGTGSNNDTTRQRFASNISMRRYDNPPRGGGYDDEQTLNTSESKSSDGHRHRRHAVRKRFKGKKKAMIPMKYMVAWTKFMQSDTKNHIVAMSGEFCGTTMFLFFAFSGTEVANIGSANTGTTTGAASGFNPAIYIYISFCFGFSLMVNAWIFYRISGGLFNPAVTLALAVLGDMPPVRAVLIFMTQISGACFSAYLVSIMFPTAFNVQTTLGPNTSKAQGIWIEALCTAELVFTIVVLAKEKHKATFIAPVGIGLSLFIAELTSVARSFGPAAVTHSFPPEHWTYWVGPIIGALIAVFFYYLFKVLEYEMVNPGQDGDAENDPTQNPDHEVAQA